MELKRCKHGMPHEDWCSVCLEFKPRQLKETTVETTVETKEPVLLNPATKTVRGAETQKTRAMIHIRAAGTAGATHESLEIALDAPKATVRRLTQELRKEGRIRLERVDHNNQTVFVAA